MYIKKSQLSLFIIIGTLMIILFIFMISTQNSKTSVNTYIPTSINEDLLVLEIQFCLDENVREATNLIMILGGHSDIGNEKYIYNFNSRVPIYLYNDTNLIPTRAEFISNYKTLIRDKFNLCIQDIIEHYDSIDGINLTYDRNSNININLDSSDNINIDVDLNLLLRNRDVIKSYPMFKSSYNYNIIQNYELVNNYINFLQLNNIKSVPISYLQSYSSQNNSRYTYRISRDGVVVYTFRFVDRENNIYYYNFAIKMEDYL